MSYFYLSKHNQDTSELDLSFISKLLMYEIFIFDLLEANLNQRILFILNIVSYSYLDLFKLNQDSLE
jgi:hypothetical protein